MKPNIKTFEVKTDIGVPVKCSLERVDKEGFHFAYTIDDSEFKKKLEELKEK